jgi:hypothetical protein
MGPSLNRKLIHVSHVPYIHNLQVLLYGNFSVPSF